MNMRQTIALALLVALVVVPLVLVAVIGAHAWRSLQISAHVTRVALGTAELANIIGSMERLASEQAIDNEPRHQVQWQEEVATFTAVVNRVFVQEEAGTASAPFRQELLEADRQFGLLLENTAGRSTAGEHVLRQLAGLNSRLVALNLERLEELRAASLSQLMAGFAIGGVLIIAGLGMALKMLTRLPFPQKLLRSATARIVQSRLMGGSMPDQRGELAELAAGFNAMTVQLGESRRRLHDHAAAQAGEQRLRELADALPHLMWAAQPDGQIDYYNSRWDEVLGSVPLPGTLWLEHVHSGDRNMVETRWREAMSSGRPFDCEFRLGHGNRWRWYAGRLAPFFDQSGRLVRWLGTASDTEERKRFESDLRQTRHRAEVLHQLGLDLAKEMDAQDAGQRIAAAAVVLTGAAYCTLHVQFTRSHGDSWQNMHAGMPSESRHSILAALDRVPLAERLPVRCDDLARPAELVPWSHHGDGAIVGSLVAVPVASRLGLTTGWLIGRHGGIGHFSAADEQVLMGVAALAAIALDNVQLLTAERAAKRLATQRSVALARSNDELEQFAYVASHDMREPVRMIGNFLGVFSRQYGAQLDDRGRHYIATALSASERMQDLIHSLLEFSRVGVQRGAVERVMVRSAVDTAMATLAEALGAVHADVVIGDLPEVSYRPTQLIQVLQNLLGNAIKFKSGQPVRIVIAAERQAEAWRLSVTDNGIGVDPQHRQKIFGMFQRLHARSSIEGMGIGLSLCKKIVEAHGGQIGVTAEPGSGSCFWFTVPDQGEATESTPPVGHECLNG